MSRVGESPTGDPAMADSGINQRYIYSHAGYKSGTK